MNDKKIDPTDSEWLTILIGFVKSNLDEKYKLGRITLKEQSLKTKVNYILRIPISDNSKGNALRNLKRLLK